MKIALLNEFSQAPKNTIVLQQLKEVVEPMGHTVYNTAMAKPLLDRMYLKLILRRILVLLICT